MSKKYKKVVMPNRGICDQKELDTLPLIGVFERELTIRNISFINLEVDASKDNIRLTSKKNPSDVWVIEKQKTTDK